MFKNYLLIAWRAIQKNKLTSYINITGLALALSSAMMIYLFVTDELSYDRYHGKAENAYRITRIFKSEDGSTNLHLATIAPPIGPLIQNDIGQVQAMARTLQFQSVLAVEENGGRKKMATENNVFLAEPTLFDILDITAIKGDLKSGIERPLTVLLSEKSAVKYFNSTDVIGKILRLNAQLNLEVTGVYADFPKQTHWHPDFLISFSTLNDPTIYGREQLETNWGNNSFTTYILLEPGTDCKNIEAMFPAFLDKHFGTYAKANYGVKPDFVASKVTALTLQPITDIHLYSHLDDELETNGNIHNVQMMTVIGIFIVLIACFNFINLSTASATKRSKEVGLRKAVGAHRNQLIAQYLSESVFITFCALILSAFVSWIALGWLNNFTQKQIEFDVFFNGNNVVGILLATLFVGLLAGIYPAFVVSGFKPAIVLKGQQGVVKGKVGIRKILVVAQFSISIVLIVATIITRQQLYFLNSEKLGFEKDYVVTMPYYEELGKTFDAFYNEVTQGSAIKNIARSSRIPTGRLLDSFGSAAITKGDSLIDTGVELKLVATDKEFFKTYGISFLAGQDFSKDNSPNDSLGFVINAAAAEALGWGNISDGIGKDFQYGDTKGRLMGVVSNFHFESLHQKVVPMVFLPIKQSWFNALSVKIDGSNFQQGLQHLEKTWKMFLPDRPFDFQFLSDTYRKLYESEERENTLFAIFSGMAIFIASLGLFGLATFNTLQRVKEISIRKVMGASVKNILTLLSKEIVILIGMATLIAWPLAWYMMSEWLATFAYHIDMDIVAYLVAGLSAIVIALATVSFQTLRAAAVNPAKALKSE